MPYRGISSSQREDPETDEAHIFKHINSPPARRIFFHDISPHLHPSKLLHRYPNISTSWCFRDHGQKIRALLAACGLADRRIYLRIKASSQVCRLQGPSMLLLMAFEPVHLPGDWSIGCWRGSRAVHQRPQGLQGLLGLRGHPQFNQVE